VAPAVLNAANEIAVEAFLKQRIGYMQIPQVIQNCLEALPGSEFAQASSDELSAVLAVDSWTRTLAESHINA
jgi:1-deoxy-D-xylulose-5-phosphate reductoisomerase